MIYWEILTVMSTDGNYITKGSEDAVSETLCFIVFRILVYEKSPKTQYFWWKLLHEATKYSCRC
jgi:hypothetical protein